MNVEAGIHGPGGADEAWRWMEFAAVGATDKLWSLTDPELRQVMVQAFLWANRNHKSFGNPNQAELEQLAAELLDGPAETWLWKAFAATQGRELQDALADVDLDDVGIASFPRPLGPDLELVIFLPRGTTPEVFGADTVVRYIRAFAMKLGTDGWRVRSMTDRITEPGWPPREGPAGPLIIE